jgi:hypothetical protein
MPFLTEEDRLRHKETMKKYLSSEKGKAKLKELNAKYHQQKKAKKLALEQGQAIPEFDNRGMPGMQGTLPMTEEQLAQKKYKTYFTTNQSGKTYVVKPETAERNRAKAREAYRQKKALAEEKKRKDEIEAKKNLPNVKAVTRLACMV